MIFKWKPYPFLQPSLLSERDRQRQLARERIEALKKRRAAGGVDPAANQTTDGDEESSSPSELTNGESTFFTALFSQTFAFLFHVTLCFYLDT